MSDTKPTPLNIDKPLILRAPSETLDPDGLERFDAYDANAITQQEAAQPKHRPNILLWICALIAIGAGFVAAMNAQSLGWPAFILLIGVAAIALITIFGLVIKKPLSFEMDPSQSEQAAPSFVRHAFDRLSEPTLITQDGKPVYCNRAYSALAAHMGALGVSDSPPTVDRLFGTKVKSASAIIFRLHHTRHDNDMAEEYIESIGSDGRLRKFRVRVYGLPEGQVWQVRDMSEDNPEDKAVLAAAPVGLFSVTPNGRVIAMNGVMRRWIGAERGASPEHMREFIENPDSLLGSDRTIGRIVRNDTRLITQKGLVTPAVMTGSWQELETGDIYAAIAVYGHSGSHAGQILTPKVSAAASAAIAGANPAPSGTDAAAPFGIARLNSTDLAKASIVEANAALVGMSGGHVQAGDRFAALFASGDQAPDFLTGASRPAGEPLDAALAGSDARPVNVYIVPEQQGEREGCIVYFVDISARKELEHQLVQSQKMQAIGQLAGGVAHDFNNLLTAIRLNTDELLGRHPVGDPSYPELQKINQTVSRAAGLVKKLLAFSRKQTLRTEVLDVTDTLSDLSVLLKQVLVERVTLNMVHGRSLAPIRADKSQLETALMNLCVNARDAVADQGGGTITITTSAASADDLARNGIDNRKGEDFVCIAVADNGTGMPPDVQAKIFEPFFTTKEQGKGTGLGLATVYGIIQQSGGHLTVESTPGEGTTFRVYLPVATGDSAQVIPLKAAASKAPPKPSDLAGQGLILFVEDEENVRTIAAKTLRKRGYTVIEAADGEEAYEILEEGEYTFDLMVSDVVMPGMDGPTLLRKGRALLGDAKIVFISGYAEEEFSDILSEHPDITFLPKPFTLLQLAQRVKEELTEE